MDANVANRTVVLGSVQGDLRNTVEKSVEVKQKIGFIDLARSICPNNQCSRLVNGIDIYLAGDPEHLTGVGSLELDVSLKVHSIIGKTIRVYISAE